MIVSIIPLGIITTNYLDKIKLSDLKPRTDVRQSPQTEVSVVMLKIIFTHQPPIRIYFGDPNDIETF